jgi:hypothetical protein
VSGRLPHDKGSDVYHNQGWSAIEKHLKDPEFPGSVRIRSIGTENETDAAKSALEQLNARDVHALSGLSVNKTVARAITAADDDYVLEGGCASVLEKRGIYVEEVIANSMLPNFRTSYWTNYEKIGMENWRNC